MSVSLRALQECFLEDVVTCPKNTNNIINQSYLPRGEFSGEDLIQVYRNNYLLSLIDTLAASYSAVKRLVGEEFFAYIAKQFIEQYPLRSGYLIDFGEEFAVFIAEHESCQQLPYLSDVARLERAYEKAYHAAEKPLYDIRGINNLVGSENIYIELHPSFHCLSSSFPVVDIWVMNEESSPPEINNNPQKFIVYRRQYKVYVELVSDDDYLLLNLLVKNHSLNEIFDVIDECFDFQFFLNKYIESQIFVNFNLK